MDDDGDLIEKARAFAKVHHGGQVRKFSGDPYFTHPEKVANALRVWDDPPGVATHEIVVAYLHDVIEDTSVTYEDIVEFFGQEIADDVMILTKQDDENYFDYIRRISESSRGNIWVKIEDLTHNMSDLEEGTLKERYRKAKAILETVLGV